MIEVKFTPAQGNWLEVTWTDVVQLPDVETPARPALFDADGNEVRPAIEASTKPGGTRTTELKHVSYHPTQLAMLQADAEAMGTPLDDHADMLAEWAASYVPPPPPSAPELLAKAKAARAAAIAAITVTTSNGNTFDGDEKSQDRMTRALAGMDEADTLPWVLADNTVAVVGRAELREALRLAGAEMAAIWVGVYA